MYALLDDIATAAADRPRYLMGVGTPDDLTHACLRIDMFACYADSQRAKRLSSLAGDRGHQQRAPPRDTAPLAPPNPLRPLPHSLARLPTPPLHGSLAPLHQACNLHNYLMIAPCIHASKWMGARTA